MIKPKRQPQTGLPRVMPISHNGTPHLGPWAPAHSVTSARLHLQDPDDSVPFCILSMWKLSQEETGSNNALLVKDGTRTQTQACTTFTSLTTLSFNLCEPEYRWVYQSQCHVRRLGCGQRLGGSQDVRHWLLKLA